MPLDLPVSSEYYSDSENQVTYILNGHTAEAPKLLIFDRKPSVYQNGQFSIPTVRIRVLEGLVDSEDKPLATKITFDLTIRWPHGASTTTIGSRLADLSTVLGSVDFVTELVEKQQLPRS